MIKVLLNVFLLALSISCFGQGISFEESKWQEALEKAKVENKLLFVDAYAQWCGPCKKMAKYEFTQKAVGDYFNANFVNLKLDMETANGRTFDSKYPVSAYPTMFFLDGDGNVVKRVRGAQKAAKLIALGESVMKSHDFSGNFKQSYEDGDRSYETVYSYVKALTQSSKPSLKISNDYLKSKPEITEEQKLKFIAEAAVEADSRLFSQLQENKSKIIALIGEDDFNKNVKRACDNTVKKAIEYDFEDLYKEAITKAKATLTSGGEIYELEATKMYASEMRDQKLYESTLLKLGKLYMKNDKSKVDQLLNEVLQYKKKSDSLIKGATSLAKKYYKVEDTAKSCLSYVSLLMVQEDYKKALKVLNKAISVEEKAGGDTRNLENFRKRVSKKLES